MIIPTFPSEDTLLRFFSARTPRYLTELFHCYSGIMKRRLVLVTADQGVLKLRVNNVCDNGYKDLVYTKRHAQWDPPHSLVWLGGDVVGVTSYSLPIIMRFDVARMEWLESVTLPLDGMKIIGAAQWLEKSRDFIYVYFHDERVIGYRKIDRFTQGRVALQQWPVPCRGVRLVMETMDFPRVLVYRDEAFALNCCAWMITPNSIEVAVVRNWNMERVEIDYIEGDRVRLSGITDVREGNLFRKRRFVEDYDIKEMKGVKINEY